MNPSSDDILTVKQVAERFNLGLSSVYDLVRRGEIPAVRFGAAIRFRASTLDSWMAEQEALVGGAKR